MISVVFRMSAGVRNMMAVACASAYTVLSKEISGRFTSIEITFIMTLCGFIFFNGSSLLMGQGLEGYRIALREPELLTALVFLGVVCSVFAFIAYNQLIGKVPAYKASTVSLSVLTVTGVVAGILRRLGVARAGHGQQQCQGHAVLLHRLHALVSLCRRVSPCL